MKEALITFVVVLAAVVVATIGIRMYDKKQGK